MELKMGSQRHNIIRIAQSVHVYPRNICGILIIKSLLYVIGFKPLVVFLGIIYDVQFCNRGGFLSRIGDGSRR